MKSSILEDFEAVRPELEALREQVVEQLQSLLQQAGIKIHSLSSRIKSSGSLAYKLGRPDRTYQSLTDITDLIGLRVTTYFEDNIEEIAALVEKAFEIDYERSIDKRKSLHASHFGYRSLHYICQPKGSPYCFELQLRTILQHAWAEIEHDLGYKSAASIPLEIRRRFSRIASLLEVADAEFVSIREFLDDYKQTVKQSLQQADNQLGIDRISLGQFLKSPEATELEHCFAERIGVELSSRVFYPDYLIRMLSAVELTSLNQLRASLLEHQPDLLQFIKPYFEFTRQLWQFDSRDLRHFLRGYSLVFLSHYLVLRSGSLGIERLEKITAFYQKIDYPHDEKTARKVAETLIETLQKRIES